LPRERGGPDALALRPADGTAGPSGRHRAAAAAGKEDGSMPMTSRAAWALGLGLGLVGAAGLVGTSFGQGDRQVQKASNAATAAGARAPVPPAIVGSVDMEKVFKDYEKVKFSSDQLKADAMKKQAELQEKAAGLKAIAKKMESFTPGSSDYKKEEERYTKLESELKTDNALAQRDFTQREAEALATLYKEVQDMVARVAMYKGMTYVVKVSNEPITGSNPESVMAGMARSIIYADKSTDITELVIYNLNEQYNKRTQPARGATARPAAAAPAPPAAGAPKGH
jgi:Skp family chaperone for outer membrane proteins